MGAPSPSYPVEIRVEDVAAARAYYERVFAAQPCKAGFRIGGAVFRLRTGAPSDAPHEATVPDADVCVARAAARGASILECVAETPEGGRAGVIADPFGHRWRVSTPRRGSSPGEQRQRGG